MYRLLKRLVAAAVPQRSDRFFHGTFFVENVYNQAADSERRPREWLPSGVPSGDAGPWATAPNRVNDYYDDPRRGDT